MPPEREALNIAPRCAQSNDFFSIQALPSYIYTGRSGWYPQGDVTDYATATLRLRVPEGYSTVASGIARRRDTRSRSRPKGACRVDGVSLQRDAARALSRLGDQPLRSRGHARRSRSPAAEGDDAPLTGVSYTFGEISVESSGMLARKGRELFDETQRVMKFYGSLVVDIPYPSFTLAIVEREQPGGHSPPYFAALSHPPPATPISWRTDPAYFDGFPGVLPGA